MNTGRGRNGVPRNGAGAGPDDALQANFFTPMNRSKLMDVIVQDFQRRAGGLNQKQVERLNKTLDHYMREVYNYEGSKPVAYLNKAVVGATVQDFDKYLQRQNSIASSQQTPQQTLLAQPPPGQSSQFPAGYLQNEPALSVPPTQSALHSTEMFEDTSRRYEAIQQQRNEGRVQPPPMPDFRISLKDDTAPAATLYEQAKRARENEVVAQAAQAAALRPQQQPATPLLPTTLPQPQATQQTLDRMIPMPAGIPPALMGQAQLQTTGSSIALQSQLPIRPDGREIYATPAGQSVVGVSPSYQVPMYEGGSGNTAIQSRANLGLAESNPTVAAPSFYSPSPPNPFPTSSGQAVVTRDNSVMVYSEKESNLMIYSYDRDWLVNSTENRYQFSVNFDQANQTNRFRYSPSVQRKLKNIVRLELIKAIFPVESLQNLVLQDTSGVSGEALGTVDTSYQSSVLSFPYVVVNLQEYDGNNNGTDNILDRSFGAIHYDRIWESDDIHNSVATASKPGPFSTQDSRGYVMLSPRYLDCQRVFTPAPLSTLQKLTIQFQRPQGYILSDLPDTFDISEIRPNTDSSFPSAAPISSASYYGNASGLASTNIAYYLIRTTYYFPRSAVNVGDRIQIAGFEYDSATVAATPGLQNFADWLNADYGHLVCNVGFLSSDGTTYSEGYNKLGYCNFIIIQGRYADPKTGTVAVNPFPGVTGAVLLAANSNLVTTPKRLLNISRQVNLIFRVITREKDAVGEIRSDNLF